jgi:GGDEF domain-containing protein
VLLLGLAALGYRVRSRRRSQSVRALQPRSALDGDLEAAVGRTRTGSDPLTLVLLQAPGLGRARGPLSRLVVQRRVGVVAAALARELPGPAYRIGADAFAVLLPGTGLPEAAVRVERVALLLERGLPVPVRAGMSSRAGTGTPTRAAEADGVVLLTSADQRPGRGEPDALFLPSEPDAALVRADADALLIRADAALHEAWSLGNGQVVVAAGAGRTPLPDDGPAASRAA